MHYTRTIFYQMYFQQFVVRNLTLYQLNYRSDSKLGLHYLTWNLPTCNNLRSYWHLQNRWNQFDSTAALVNIYPNVGYSVCIHTYTLLAWPNQRQLQPVDASLKQGSNDWLKWRNYKTSHTTHKVYKRNCRRADIRHMTTALVVIEYTTT
jgi:hypothetical protein